MTSQAKSSSKWGTFFQQAVAGVESRLDTILADGDTASVPLQKPSAPVESIPVDEGQGVSRLPIIGRNSDRLQERLAKAIGSRNATPLSSSDSIPDTRTASATQGSASPRLSIDSTRQVSDESQRENGYDHRSAGVPTGEQKLPTGGDNIHRPGSMKETPFLSVSSEAREASIATQPENSPVPSDSDLSETFHSTSLGEYKQIVEQLRTEKATAELQWTTDVNRYHECIDSLQAKLQYLGREAVNESRSTVKSIDSGDFQRRLAERDEKIALLMEEGTNLSQNEMKLMNTIRSLRAKSAEDDRSLSRSRHAEAEMRKEILSLKEMLKALEQNARDAKNHAESLAQAQADLRYASEILQAKDLEISKLQQRLAQNRSSQEPEGTDEWKRKLASEQALVSQLKEEVDTASTEMDLLASRHASQLRDLQAKLEHEGNLRRAVELDLKGELQVMESRLEAYRTRAEEISSDGRTDIQAKLIRQIETLQSSYSVASENWRGIESTLLSRIAGFEKELSDMHKKEIDLRRKTRDSHNKCRELEKRLSQETNKIQELEDTLLQEKQKALALRSSLVEAEADLEAALAQSKTVRDDSENRLGRFKVDQREEVPDRSSSISGNNSPVLRANVDDPTTQLRRLAGSPGLGVTNVVAPYGERPFSRRTSLQPSQSFGIHRQDSSLPLHQSLRKEGVSINPTSMSENLEELYEGLTSPVTPERTVNDVISTATPAGPSVQLVERMSAAVRRLESEKAASRDEIDRLSTQRDEARNQVVGLIHELEGTKAAEVKRTRMEKEIQELNVRLQTTLEMLGEKSELVEELKADIVDMKEIYRSTIENTVK